MSGRNQLAGRWDWGDFLKEVEMSLSFKGCMENRHVKDILRQEVTLGQAENESGRWRGGQ